MSSLTGADTLRIGSSSVSKVYHGADQIWPTATVPVTIQGTPTTGIVASSLTATITLPTYNPGDYLLLVVSRNQGDTTAWTGDANASINEIANSTRRLNLIQVQPVSAATSFVLHASTSGLWSWCCLNLGQVNPTVQRAVNSIGNSTTSPIEFLPVATSPSTDGNQLAIAVANANAAAVWTAPALTTIQIANGTAPGLLIASFVPSAGLASVTVGNADRGNSGANRFEASILAVFRA
jgi:hypothetical protein